MLDKLRSRFNKLETLKEQVQGKLDAQPHETDEVHQARQFASFNTEVQKLRLVWEKKPFPIRKEFVNLFVEKATISIVAPHWLALHIVWSYPAWGKDTIYLWRNHGAQDTWTEEEVALVIKHHQTRDMEIILQALPTKTWKAIKRKSLDMGLPTRPRTALPYPTDLCWLDLQFMQEHGIDRDTRSKCVAQSSRQPWPHCKTGHGSGAADHS